MDTKDDFEQRVAHALRNESAELPFRLTVDDVRARVSKTTISSTIGRWAGPIAAGVAAGLVGVGTILGATLISSRDAGAPAASVPLSSMSASSVTPSEQMDLVAVPTQEPAEVGRPCLGSRAEGTLVAHPRDGLGLELEDGTYMTVVWPHGFVARRAGDGLELLDAEGLVIGVEGDPLTLGGGTRDGVWYSCG